MALIPTPTTGIDTLAPETLISIFLICTSTNPIDPTFCYAPPRNLLRDNFVQNGDRRLGWVNATYVCRRWRSIMLECSALWTEITDTMGVRWARAFFTRSQDLPVSYTCGALPRMLYNSENTSDNLIHDNLHRMRALIRVSSDPIEQSLLLKPAPLLERCRFRLSSFEVHPDDEKLFLFEAPRLRHLYLSDVRSFSWQTPFLENLTALHLFGNYEADIPVTVDAYFALQRMHFLEVLEIHHFLPKLRTADNHITIKLPRLKHLTLFDIGDAIVQLMSCLRLDIRVQIALELNCASPDGHDDMLSPLIYALRRHYQAGDGRNADFEAASVFRCPIGDEHIKLFVRASFEDKPDTSLILSSSDLSVTVIWDDSEGSSGTFTRDICHALPLSSISSLRIMGEWEDELLKSTFRNARRLSRLCIVEGNTSLMFCGARDCICELECDTYHSAMVSSESTTVEASAPTMGTAPLFPALKDIHICVKEDYDPYDTQLHELTPPLDYEELERVVVSRRNAGVPLQSIHLYLPRLRPGQLPDEAPTSIPREVLQLLVELEVVKEPTADVMNDDEDEDL